MSTARTVCSYPSAAATISYAVFCLKKKTSMAIWHFVLASGVYARVVAMGFGGLAWWAHAMALSRHSGEWWALTALLIAANVARAPWRSEEHTSELQTRFALVFRPRPDKKNTTDSSSG